MQEYGVFEIIPVLCISAIWGQHPGFLDFSHAPELLSTEAEGGWVVASAESQTLFSVSGAFIHIWKPQNADGCDMLVYWCGRKCFFHSPSLWLEIQPYVRDFSWLFFFFVPLLWKDVWDQRKVLVDMLLQVLTYRLGPLIDNRRFSGSFIF